jgi:anti-sigma-K factor RskA
VNGHPQFEEEFDLYVMGALDADEKQALEAHVRACSDCAAKLEEARGRMALMAVAVPQQDLPEGARGRLMQRIHAETPRAQTAEPGSFLRWLAPLLAAAALALLVFAIQLKNQNRELAGRQAELQSQVDKLEQDAVKERAVLDLLTASDSVRVTLVSGSARPVPEGRAFYNSRKGLLFYASNLPMLTADRTYQLWLVPTNGDPISAGVFQVDASGSGEVTLPDLPPNVTAKGFAVTVEPSGGVPKATGPKVLLGLVS